VEKGETVGWDSTEHELKKERNDDKQFVLTKRRVEKMGNRVRWAESSTGRRALGRLKEG